MDEIPLQWPAPHTTLGCPEPTTGVLPAHSMVDSDPTENLSGWIEPTVDDNITVVTTSLVSSLLTSLHNDSIVI